MIIAVDVDDVCAELVPAWLDRYNARYQDDLTPQECTTWDLTKIVKPECGTAIYNILKEPDLYCDVRPVDGARVGIETLRRNHDVVFVTSCGYDPATIGASAGAKLAWLQRYGFLPNDRSAAGQYIIASEKWRVCADVLIDDRATTIQNWPGRGLLFDRPHNQDYAGAYGLRVLNWIDAVRAIA